MGKSYNLTSRSQPRGRQKIPFRHARHYYDLAKMALSAVKNEALSALKLLEDVVIFKQKFYMGAWAQYEDAKVGTFKVLPPEFWQRQELYILKKRRFLVDLNRILHFITIAECGSYTKAGQKLGLPKSTLSKSLSSLEEQMQVRLLNRSTRKLSLTYAGEKFFQASLPLITGLQNAHSQVSELNEKVKGNLKITMSYEMGYIFISKVIPEFMESYPEINFEFDFSSENKNLIEDGYDLAIRAGELDDSSYIAKKLTSSTVGFYASKQYIQRYGEPRTLDDLQYHARITTPLVNAVKLIPSEQAKVPVPVNMACLTSNSILFNKRICIAGKGVASIADVFCVEEVERGELVKVLKGQEAININIYLVYPSRNHRSKALIIFNDFLLNKAKTTKFS